MSFGGLILTNNGRNKMAAAISEKNALSFTHIQLGDGNFNGSYSSKTELTHKVMEIPVTRVQRKDNEVLIECDWNSKQAPAAFYLREIGIIGNDVLCYYDNARSGDAEYIDPESEAVSKQKRFRFTISVTDDANITTMISSELYALAEEVEQSLFELKENKLDKTGDAKDATVTFAEAETRENITSGEKLSVIFGKISKFFSDLKAVAFSGSYNDLNNRPSIPPAVAVKGNAENTYRTGNVNLTPANIGAQPSLGFTPVQQGGGSGQGSNKVYIGWTGAQLKIQVDNTDMGGIPTTGGSNGATLPVSRGGTGATDAAAARSNLGITPANIGALPLSGGSITNRLNISNAIQCWIHTFYGETKGVNLASPYTNIARFEYGKSKGWNGDDEGITIQFSGGFSYLNPEKNGNAYLGTATQKWNQIYSTNSAISTSDRRKKKDISYIGQDSEYDTQMTEDQLKQFIMGLSPCIYRLIDGESGRPHHGLIAQDIEKLMKEIGLSDHAAFIKSPKTRDVEVEKEIEAEEVDPETGEVKTLKKVVKELQQEEIPGEYIYSLRYEEFISDIIRFIQLQNNCINKLEDRLAESEKKNVDLEKRIEKLEKLIKQ